MKKYDECSALFTPESRVLQIGYGASFAFLGEHSKVVLVGIQQQRTQNFAIFCPLNKVYKFQKHANIICESSLNLVFWKVTPITNYRKQGSQVFKNMLT